MSNLRALAQQIWEAALASVAPERVVGRALAVGDQGLTVLGKRIELAPGEHVRLVALGKAADSLGRAVARRLGDRLADGLVVTKEGHATHAPFPRVAVIEAAHPVPDARSLAAGERISAFLRGGRPGDLVLLLVSGGASALAVSPRPPLTLADLQEVTDLLLRSGATIHELNVVRKHLDLLKGGGLLKQAAPARVAALLLSDVVGDSPATIGSGPAVPDPSTFADAMEVLDRRDLRACAPARVLDLLARGMKGEEPETLKPEDPLAALATTDILARGADAVDAAAAQAAGLGFRTLVLTTRLEGEARVVGRELAAMVHGVSTRGDPISPPAALLWGGETTVRVRGDGLGGRNQELALAAALAIAGLEEVCLAAIGTDGTDGPTEAAGGIVDGETALRARTQGIDLEAALARNDSYHALAALGDLVVTGPTGTHVNDLGFALVRGRGANPS